MRVVLVSLALLAVPAQAVAADLPRRQPPGTAAPNVLPASGASAAAVQPATWLVGARPGARAQAIAARHGADRLSPRGIYVVPRGRARAFATALRAAGVYRFAEPDQKVRRQQAPSGGDDYAATDWRVALIPATIAPPAPTAAPLTAVIDDAVDTTHPDLAGVLVTRRTAVTGLHGTAVSSVIAGRANAFGMVGVYPGAPVLSVGTDFTISDIIRCVAAATAAKARILNMSYGAPGYSYGEHVELAYAVSQGVLPIASAGNDRTTQLPDGTTNPVMFPAALPHVVSVASVGPSGASSDFSTSNGAVDVSAPGESVLTAVPVAFDDDGTANGFERLDGTSFAAPIVSGAAAWLLAQRPELSAGQAADLLRWTATNIGPAGWDANSGYGIINLPAALTQPAPAPDTVEVNDDIEWVNGRRFSKPDPFFFRARNRKRTAGAMVDYWKDPADVYRIQLPARRRLRLTITMPRGANADLAVFSRKGRTIYRRRGLLKFSDRKRGKTDRVTIRNRGRRAKVAYAVIYSPTPSDGRLDAPYRLTVRR